MLKPTDLFPFCRRAILFLFALCATCSSAGCGGDRSSIEDDGAKKNKKKKKKKKKRQGSKRDSKSAGRLENVSVAPVQRGLKAIQIPCAAQAKLGGEARVLVKAGETCSWGAAKTDEGSYGLVLTGPVRAYELPGTGRREVPAKDYGKAYTALASGRSFLSHADVTEVGPKAKLPLASPFTLVTDEGEWKGTLRFSLNGVTPFVMHELLRRRRMVLFQDDEIPSQPGAVLVVPVNQLYQLQIDPFILGKPMKFAAIDKVALIDAKARKLGRCSYQGKTGRHNINLTAYDADIRVRLRRTGKEVMKHVVRAKGTPSCKRETTMDNIAAGTSVYAPTSDIVAWLNENVL